MDTPMALKRKAVIHCMVYTKEKTNATTITGMTTTSPIVIESIICASPTLVAASLAWVTRSNGEGGAVLFFPAIFFREDRFHRKNGAALCATKRSD